MFSSDQRTAMLGLSLAPSILITVAMDEIIFNISELAYMNQEFPSPECIRIELNCL